ncbi:MAG TPA: efflux RND transporter periplasmic adaptor subunit [Planctomycetota bacterium]|nr:efflux RND transporter periplasmic adaptor subunit [Planctomycetota bacterium]
MLRHRTLIIAALAALAGAAAIALTPATRLFVRVDDGGEGREPGVRWACAMMDYLAETRGDGRCPVCGMTLERIVAGALSDEQRRRMGVATTVVEAVPAVITVHAYGTARADERTRRAVVARVAGRVVRRHPGGQHAGAIVAADEPLVDLYSPALLGAQAELAAAIASGDDQLAAALTTRFARWNLAGVAEAIRRGEQPTDTVTIVSPFAGRVVVNGVLPAVGDEIAADRPLLDLVDPHRFIVVLHVPEAEARFLRPGQRAALASDDAGDLAGLEARVDWLSPTLDTAARTRETHLHVVEPSGRLLDGALVTARLRAALGPDLAPADPEDEASWGRFVAVPRSAVLSTGTRDIAWKATGDDRGAQRFAIAELALGPRLGDRVIVRSGLEIGDVVATAGAFLIDSQAQLAGAPSLLFPDGAATP